MSLPLITIDFSVIDTMVHPSITSPTFIGFWFPGLAVPTMAITSVPMDIVPYRTGFGPSLTAGGGGGGGAFGSKIATSVRSKLNGLLAGIYVQIGGAGVFGGKHLVSLAHYSSEFSTAR